MKTDQEPIALAWWVAFLSLWRSLLLMRSRPDPAALRALLVSLPAVDLTWVDVARLLHWENLYGFPNREQFDVPEDWTLGPPISPADYGTDDVLELANTQVVLALLREHPEFKNQWEIIHQNGTGQANPHLSYQVVDSRGKATEIAKFLQGKLNLWKQGEPLNEAEFERIAKEALALNISYSIIDAQYQGETGDEDTDELLYTLDLRTLPKGWEKQLAEQLWDTSAVDMLEGQPIIADWSAMLKAAHSLTLKKKRKLTAADLAA